MGNHDFVYLLNSSLPVAGLLNMMAMMMTPGGNDIMTIALVSWGTKSQSPSLVLLNPEQERRSKNLYCWMKCVVKKVAIPGYRLCLLHLCKTKQQQSTFFLSCDFCHVVDCDHMTMILPITFWSSDLAPEALTFAKIRPPNIQPVLSFVTRLIIMTFQSHGHKYPKI